MVDRTKICVSYGTFSFKNSLIHEIFQLFTFSDRIYPENSETTIHNRCFLCRRCPPISFFQRDHNIQHRASILARRIAWYAIWWIILTVYLLDRIYSKNSEKTIHSWCFLCRCRLPKAFNYSSQLDRMVQQRSSPLARNIA